MLNWLFALLIRATCALALSQVQVAAFQVDRAFAAAQAVPSMRLSADGKYLINPLGDPVFIAGDSPWSLITQVSLEEAGVYLSNRAAKGFNLIIVNLIEVKFSSRAPRNYYGQAPFGMSGGFRAPSEAYFAHADAVINLAREKGITVLLDPIYLGYDCGDQGWCAQVKNASLTEMRAWGRYLGNRYRDFPNIIWLIGADTNPFAHGVAGKLREVVAGIKEADPGHLMTAHTAPGSSAQDIWNGEAWLDLNTIYHYGIDPLLSMAREQYRRPQALPLFMMESAYEREHESTPASLRQQAYGGVLWGGTLGSIFGNCPLWSLGYNAGFCSEANWKDQLDSVGSVQFGHFASFMRSHRFWLLVPDHDHTVMTDGYGSGAAMATTARASDGSTILSYMPTGRQVAIEMSKILDAKGQAKCSWYNPRTGVATPIGTYPNSGRRSFTPPDANDWVLVVESSSTGATRPLTTVSAASYERTGVLAADVIAAGYGDDLSPWVELAPPAGPLPETLAGTSVDVTDALGVHFSAPLWFVSPTQINFLVPAGTPSGPASVAVLHQSQTVASGTLQIASVAPGLFTMNANGQGVPAALAIFFKADGTQTWRYVFEPGCQAGSCEPAPIDMGPAADQVYLQLYGTGIRGRSSLAAVTANIGGVDAPVSYAGPVAGLSGLDQVNVGLPRSLQGRGQVDIVLTIDGRTSNTVRVNIQ